MAYISVIETGNANLTCKNIDFIAKSFNIKPALLFNEDTAFLSFSYFPFQVVLNFSLV